MTESVNQTVTIMTTPADESAALVLAGVLAEGAVVAGGLGLPPTPGGLGPPGFGEAPATRR